MRMVVVLGLLASCDKGKSKPPPPAPAPEVQRPLDAAVVDAVVATGPVITRGGVGTFGKVDWSKLDNDALIARVKTAIPLRDATVSFDVMELPFHGETEEGYFSIKRGEEELAQVLRTHDDKPAAVVVWTNEIPTAQGIRVGDKVDTIVAKRPDLACTVDMMGTFVEMIAVYVACTSPAEPEITYFIDVGQQMFKNGPIETKRIANLAIVGIGHAFVGS